MSVRKGTYALFLTFANDITVTVGALGPHIFHAGTYCYVGSAMGGLDQRVSRHLTRDKRIRWHIDNLTTVCDSSEAWESYPDPVGECELAHMAEECGGIPEMDGFGCSDCGCRTHLFRMEGGAARELVSRAGLARFPASPRVR